MTREQSKRLAENIFMPITAVSVLVAGFWSLALANLLIKAVEASHPTHVFIINKYMSFFNEHPVIAIVVPVQILLGLVGAWLLRTRIPKSPNQVYPLGVSAFGYYVTINVFWFAIYVELLFPITSIAFDFPILWDVMAILIVLLAVGAVFLWLCIVREKFRPEHYRGVVTPILMTATPGLSILTKLSALKMLPKSVSDLLEPWILKSMVSLHAVQFPNLI